MFEPKAIVAIAGMISTSFVCWKIIEEVGKWLARRHQVQSGMPADQEARMQRIEQAVEAVAIEVERIGEGQRYTTQLLADRARADAAMTRLPSGYKPVVTPH